VLLAPSRRPVRQRPTRGRRPAGSGRGILLGAIALVLVQAGIGMDVNLHVSVPSRHPGAHAASFLSGSFDSVVWAIGHGAPALAAHAALGLALALLVLGALRAMIRRARLLPVLLALLGALLVIGAGFNGAAFLDYAHAANSLAMALLALCAIACYAAALALLD